MVTSLCLCCCVLATAQPAERADWLLVPRLGRAQELVYRGSFTEEAAGSGVQFHRTYRFETRILVVDTPAQGADVFLLTVLRLRSAPASGVVRASSSGDEGGVYSARLESARLDFHGRVTAGAGGSVNLPLDGPPTIEAGCFVEAPKGRLGTDQSWEVHDDGRPVRLWRVAGNETVNGLSCVKLVGVQQSDDWDSPRADRAAWRRLDTMWIAPRLGIAQRVERVIERRETARKEPSQRSVLRYDLESNLQYPGPLFNERRREIQQARLFAESAAPLLPAPAKHSSQLEAVLAKINHHLDNHPPTPYREAVLLVKRRVEAARRGETPPSDPVETTPAATVAIGKPAPDFVAPDHTAKESARLRQWQGKPMVLVFYNPTSAVAEEVLLFAQTLKEFHGDRVAVLGLAMSNDGEGVRKQHAELRLSYPILNGAGLRISYGVEATPRVVVIDADGIVRGAYLGWGGETPDEVRQELRRWPGRK